MAAGRGPQPGPQSREGMRRRCGCRRPSREGSAAAGPSGGGGAPGARASYSPRGPRGSGRPHSGELVERSPPPRPRPRWEARRDGQAASLPLLLSPSYKYRLGPHPPPPTPGALRKVRRPRAGPRERKGDAAALMTAPAPAVLLPPQLEAWPPAAPAPPSPSPSCFFSSNPRQGPDSSPGAVCRGRACRAPSLLCRARGGGGRLWYPAGTDRRGRRAFSLARQLQSFLPGGIG